MSHLSSIGRFLLSLLLVAIVAVATGCAEGELGENQETNNNSNQADVSSADTNITTIDDVGTDTGLDTGGEDTSTPDDVAPVDDADADTGVDDTGAGDTGQDVDMDAETDADAGEPCDDPCQGTQVCDPDTGECVDCLGDDDCEEAVCDESAQQCVECVDKDDCDDGVCLQSASECVDCLGDGDCPDGVSCDSANMTCLGCVDHDDCEGDAKCHDEYPTCVDECCDFISEVVFDEIPYSHDRFDIAVTPDGEPIIAFVDGDNNDILIAERTSNGWFQQTLGSFSGGSTSSHIRLDVDADGQPHVVFRRFENWTYWRRDGGTWHEEDVWDEELTSGYPDIAVDSEGDAHIFGLASVSHEVYYAHFSSDQQSWTREIFAGADEETNVNWLAADLKSDDTPVVSLSANSPDEEDTKIRVVTHDGSGWNGEVAVHEVTQVHHMVVSPDDEVLIVHRAPEIPHDGVELTRNGSGSWVSESVNNRSEAITVHLAVDSRNDPHFVFNVSGEGDFENHLVYTRWDGTDWETHDPAEEVLERAFWQRIAVDDDYTPHIVVYDSTSDALTYVTLDE